MVVASGRGTRFSNWVLSAVGGFDGDGPTGLVALPLICSSVAATGVLLVGARLATLIGRQLFFEAGLCSAVGGCAEAVDLGAM